MTGARPPYVQGRLVGLVFLGGAIGTLARWAVGLTVPHVVRVPLGTVVVNVLGAFLLGALLEHLAGRGPNPAGGAGGRPPQETARRRALRLTLGTGFCGGLTTYSSFVVQSHDRGPVLGSATVVVTLVPALLLCALGFWVGAQA